MLQIAFHLGYRTTFCDIDFGDKNYDISMVSKTFISQRPYLKQK